MSDLYSKLDSRVLLCSIVRAIDSSRERREVSAESARLQTSLRHLPKGFLVRRHRHLPVKRETVGTSEVWIVVQGSIRGTVFDLDDTFLDSFVLSSGDLAVFHEGGHELECLEENTRFVEVKNGPYPGRERDKIEFI